MIDLKGYLSKCELCPRRCGVNRNAGELGFCQSGILPRLALASLHQWEEPCLSGEYGSGTVFFSGCTLRCVFCQNHEISWENSGREVSINRLAEIFLEQTDRGAHNINLVTPAHYAPQTAAAIDIARRNGLKQPVVWNTNAYETEETVSLLAGRVDIFLPDLKYFHDRWGIRYSGVSDYFRHAAKAIARMVEIAGPASFASDGMMTRGVIVRHLALPGLFEDSRRIIEYLYRTFGDSIYISLMNQYTPVFRASQFTELSAPLPDDDYQRLIEYALSLGVENGFIQEGGAVSESFIPNFDQSGI